MPSIGGVRIKMESPYEKSSDLHPLRDRSFTMSQGGHGFSEKCGVSKLYPPKNNYR